MLITAKEFADKLHNRHMEMINGLTEEEEKQARENNLLVIYGYSDDNTELGGIIHDEVSSWERTEICITPELKVLTLECDCKAAEREFEREKKTAFKFFAEFNKKDSDSMWTFDLPDGIKEDEFASFDMLEEDDIFCRGHVIELKRYFKRRKHQIDPEVFLLSEVATLQDFIEHTPKEHLLELMSWKSRLEQVEKELKELRETFNE